MQTFKTVRNKLIGALAGAALLGMSGTALAVTVTMDELAPQALNGTSLKGVTFSTSDTGATFNFTGNGGNGLFITEPVSEGSTGILLTLDFANLSSGFGFGYALNTTGQQQIGQDGVRVELFDLSLTSLGIFNNLTTNLTIPGFVEGLFGSALTGISRATLLFSPNQTATRFGIDNVTFAPIPLPAALPLFLGALAGLGGLGAMKRRRKAAA